MGPGEAPQGAWRLERRAQSTRRCRPRQLQPLSQPPCPGLCRAAPVGAAGPVAYPVLTSVSVSLAPPGEGELTAPTRLHGQLTPSAQTSSGPPGRSCPPALSTAPVVWPLTALPGTSRPPSRSDHRVTCPSNTEDVLRAPGHSHLERGGFFRGNRTEPHSEPRHVKHMHPLHESGESPGA